MSTFGIILSAFEADAESICLCEGEVKFKVRGSWGAVDCPAENYRALWEFASKLELNDVSRTRTMAPELLPDSLRDKWTLRVYVGPNAFGKTNVLINPLPTSLPPIDLSVLGFQRVDAPQSGGAGTASSDTIASGPNGSVLRVTF